MNTSFTTLSNTQQDNVVGPATMQPKAWIAVGGQVYDAVGTMVSRRHDGMHNFQMTQQFAQAA